MSFAVLAPVVHVIYPVDAKAIFDTVKVLSSFIEIKIFSVQKFIL